MKIKILAMILAIVTSAVAASFAGVRYGSTWEITISAKSGDDSNDLTIGGDKTATDAFENRWETRALLSGSIMAYFSHPEWALDTPYFWSDIRDLNFPKEWTFHVASRYASMELAWDVSILPKTLELTLIDTYSGTSVNMKDAGSYVYANSSTVPRLFMVSVTGRVGDDIPPDTVIITQVGQWIGSSVTIDYSGTDDTSAPDALEFSYAMDAGAWSEWSFAASSGLTGIADGPHTFRVKAKDQAGNEDPTPAEAAFTVDTGAPALTLNSPDPPALWPPKGNMVSVKFSGQASDVNSGLDGVFYVMTDEYGEFSSSGGVSVGVDGQFSFDIPLKAWRRNNDMDGRTYFITVTAVDKAGNRIEKQATVEVPHNMRKKRK